MNSSQTVGRGFKIAYPIFLEASYKRQLSRLACKIERLSHDFLTLTEFELAYNKTIRNDDIIDDLGRVLSALKSAISVETDKVIQTLSKHFSLVKTFVGRSFYKSFNHLATRSLSLAIKPLAVATPVVNIDLLKRMWVEKNTSLIKSIQADSLSKINDAVYESVRHGESIQSLSLKLNKIFKSTKKRAQIIARDQISSLKSDLSRHNDLAHGFTIYEWSACTDDAVRPSHKVMQGKICSWLDSSIYKNKITDQWKKRSSIGGIQKHVGADILCRCTNLMLQEEL
jgi:SPP1 gp7 family putative phage head morphogenesis protein